MLDPQKRLTVQQALEHPWVTGKAAKFAHMDSTQRKLQEFNARRKLKVMIERLAVHHSNTVCIDLPAKCTAQMGTTNGL